MPRPHRPCGPHGFTLLEMMVALVVGLVVLVAAATLLRQSRDAYDEIDSNARLHASARLALEHLALALAHAGHQAPDSGTPWVANLPALRRAPAGELDINLRGSPDGDVHNCGNGQPPTSINSRTHYTVGTREGGQLFCSQRNGLSNARREALIEGVQAMRLEYGVDSDNDGHADQWRQADTMDARAWRRVRLVQVHLAMRTRDAPQWFQTTAWLRNAAAAGNPP